MSEMKRFYKFSAGVFCGCLVCFLVFGCGGKGKTDSPEKKKQTKDVVRKIPVTETQPETAAGKQSEANLRPEGPAAVSGPQKKAAVPEETKQQTAPAPAPTESGQVSTPASQETATPSAQPETSSEATPVPVSTEEKKAEMDAVIREAGKLKDKEAVIAKGKDEHPVATAEAVHAGGTPPAAGGLTETEQEAPPVIDLGLKEAAEAGEEENNLLGYGQEGEGQNAEEGQSRDVFNPFAPLFQKEKTGVAVTVSPDRQQRKFITELEKIDIGQLTLEGIIQAQSGNRAIVTDASGKGYVVKEGTYVGLNSGTVEKIESDRIVIAENLGTRQSKTVLKLQKPAGE